MQLRNDLFLVQARNLNYSREKEGRKKKVKERDGLGWVGFMVMGSGGVVMTDGIDERATVVEKWWWHIAKRLLSPALIFEFSMQKKNASLPPYFSF